jgi:hypothetical protein
MPVQPAMTLFLPSHREECAPSPTEASAVHVGDNKGIGGDNIKKIAPMIPESDLISSITHQSGSIMTSIESDALMTSVHAEVTVAPTVSVPPKVARPFEAEPHHVGNGSLVIIGRALEDNQCDPDNELEVGSMWMAT